MDNKIGYTKKKESRIRRRGKIRRMNSRKIEEDNDKRRKGRR
jgi:hypothetical protein